MVIKGWQKFSLLDYPEKISCILFVANCNFRCPFCHNRDLVLNSPKLPQITQKEVLSFLKKRKGQLDGVVITGGEPSLYKDLKGFIKKIKALGYLVKLDTNGSNPEMVRDLIANQLVDYWAMDIKGPLDERYTKITNFKLPIEEIRTSMGLILNSKVSFEFRTTVVPTIHDQKVLLEIANQLEILMSETTNDFKWFLQTFLPQNCLNSDFINIKPYSQKEMEQLYEEVKKVFPKVYLRGKD